MFMFKNMLNHVKNYAKFYIVSMQGGYVYLSTFACMLKSKYRSGLKCHAFRNGYNIYLLMFLIFTWHRISVCCKRHNMISVKVKSNQKGQTWLDDVFALKMWKARQWNDAKSKDMINLFFTKHEMGQDMCREFHRCKGSSVK